MSEERYNQGPKEPRPLTVAIVGRPNVGKSRLFNRIAGRAAAIVHDTPGVTRDRQALDVDFAGLAMTLVDTAGFEDAASGSLAQRMTDQTLAAIAEAGVLLFVIDARAGLTTGDEIIAQALHKSGKPVILLANKCEGRTQPLDDIYALGFGEPLRISAEHNLGIDAIADALAPLAPASAAVDIEDDDDSGDEDAPEEGTDVRYLERPLRLALVGRPNVGKSSLFNRLLGEERALTGPEAGLTRDAVTAPWKIEGGKAHDRAGSMRDVLLHDTAGLRKKARMAGETLEEMSVASTLEAIRFSDCVIVMIDAIAVRETGPDHRRPDCARRPRYRLRGQQMGPLGKQGRRHQPDARKAGPPVAAGGRRAAGRHLGAHRRRPGPAGARDRGCRPRLEHARGHRHAEPLPGSRLDAPCPTGRLWTARAHPLHDPAQGAPAQLHAVRQPTRRPARRLSALSAEWAAREFRPERHAAAFFPAQQQEPVRSKKISVIPSTGHGRRPVALHPSPLVAARWG
jgi:small GTP-binding protein